MCGCQDNKEYRYGGNIDETSIRLQYANEDIELLEKSYSGAMSITDTKHGLLDLNYNKGTKIYEIYNKGNKLYSGDRNGAIDFIADSFIIEYDDEQEGIDLFEDYENIPEEVQAILDEYQTAFEDGDYKGLEQAHKELERIGYTFDYYLDGQAYDLRPIGTKGKVELESEKFDKEHPKFQEGGSIDSERRFTEFDFNKLMDGEGFRAIWSGYVWEIYPEGGGKVLGKFNPKTKKLFIIGKKDLSNTLVEYLQQNSYVSNEEYFKLENGGGVGNLSKFNQELISEKGYNIGDNIVFVVGEKGNILYPYKEITDKIVSFKEKGKNKDLHIVTEKGNIIDYYSIISKYAKGGGVNRDVILQVGDMVKIMPNYASHYTNQKAEIVKEMPDLKTYEVKIKHKNGNEYAKFDKSELVFLGNQYKYANGGGVGNGMLNFVVNEMSSGFIANNSNANTYSETSAIRNKMIKILQESGDRDYSLKGAVDLVKEAEMMRYADGGGVDSIPNNYEGKSPKDIWASWSKEQRKHFLYDHKSDARDSDEVGDSKGYYYSHDIDEWVEMEWNELPLWIKNLVFEHTDNGQYANGGGVEDWFWNYAYRHYLRDASLSQRNKVKSEFIKRGLELDGESPEHAYIVVSIVKPEDLKYFNKISDNAIEYEIGGTLSLPSFASEGISADRFKERQKAFVGYLGDVISIQIAETFLGRKINSWEDDIIIIGDTKYKKIYLKPEYKRIN